MLETYKKHIVESYTVDNEQNWDINIKAHGFLRETNNTLIQNTSNIYKYGLVQWFPQFNVGF